MGKHGKHGIHVYLPLFDIVKRCLGLYRVHNHTESDHNFILLRKEAYSMGNMQYFTAPMHILQESILIWIQDIFS